MSDLRLTVDREPLVVAAGTTAGGALRAHTEGRAVPAPPVHAVAVRVNDEVVRDLSWRPEDGDRLESVWADDGPRYGPGVSPDDLDVSEQDPEDHRLTDIEFDGRHDFGGRHDRDDRRD